MKKIAETSHRQRFCNKPEYFIRHLRLIFVTSINHGQIYYTQPTFYLFPESELSVTVELTLLSVCVDVHSPVTDQMRAFPWLRQLWLSSVRRYMNLTSIRNAQ